MPGGTCGCASASPTHSTMVGGYVQHKGGEHYLSQLVNLAIPVGFVLAGNAMKFLKDKNTVISQKGGGDDFMNRIKHVSFRIQQFVNNHPR